MSTQPRDNSGRFGHVERSAVQLDLVLPPSGGDIQEEAYTCAWDTSFSDTERVGAALTAVEAHRLDDPGLSDVLGPDPEALVDLEEALRDDETVLDAIHSVGPLPGAQPRNFGALVAGAAYDLWTSRREDDVEASLLAP